MKKIVACNAGILLLLFAFVVITGCDKDELPALTDTDELVSGDANCSLLRQELDAMPMEELSEDELAGIAFMREEEKLARDVYLFLFERWGTRVFDNISRSEQTHMDAIDIIQERYDLPDPAEGNGVGVFENPDLQALHDQLVERGAESIIEALRAGAYIEETDIIDIQEQIDEVVDNRDVELVYSNLLRGSKNHLRAFVRNLSARGIDYEAQVLEPERLEEILEGAN